MARISLCMIVKDEEAMLPGCLASVRGAVDDMVVVDTGSKDATRRLAVEGGARVYDFAWCNDFAAARNVSLRHAHGDWVLVLDADERLAPNGAAALRASIKRARFDVGMLPLHNATHLGAKAEDIVSGAAREGEPCFVPRLLRNTDGLAYVGRIHENVGPWLRRRGVRVQGVEAPLVHFGSTKEIVGARDKVERNSKLLLERIERDPTDFEAYGYLAGEYFRAEQFDLAYDIAARGWPHFEQCPDFVPAHRLGAVRAQLQVRKGEYEGARTTLRDARTRGQNPDFPFLEAYTYESEALKATDPSRQAELLSLARAGYRECLDLAHISFINVFTNGCTTWYGQTRLGIVELQLGNLESAREAFENALTYRSENEAARLGLAEAALDAGDAAGALVRVEPLLGKTADAWILASTAATRLGRLGDARVFAKHAVKLLPAGLVGPHRRGRFLALVEKLNAAAKVAATNAGAGSGALPVPA
jgi:glycosyltransferase involved in cell wall biosynthesis